MSITKIFHRIMGTHENRQPLNEPRESNNQENLNKEVSGDTQSDREREDSKFDANAKFLELINQALLIVEAGLTGERYEENEENYEGLDQKLRKIERVIGT